MSYSNIWDYANIYEEWIYSYKYTPVKQIANMLIQSIITWRAFPDG